MMKKYLLAASLFLLIVSAPLADSLAFCIVTSSRDYQPCSMGSGMNVNPDAYLRCRIREFRHERRTLRYQVEREYRDENTADPAPTIENPVSQNGTCPTGDHDANYTEASDSDPLDDWLGFEQAILFATSEWDNPNTPAHNESWRYCAVPITEETDWVCPPAQVRYFDINTIALRAPISFQNRYDNVVVGNWTLTTPPESLFDYVGSGDMSYGDRLDVLNMFPTVYRDHGSVTIDGTDLDENQSPFVCGTNNTSPVILRNLVILTNGVTSAEFFSRTNQDQDCFQDGGDLFICGGEVDEGRVPGAAGWCDEDEDVPPAVEDCDNGVSDDDDDLIDCEDTEDCPFGSEACPAEICDNGVDDDGDALIDCDDPDCGEEPACQIEICDNLMDDGDDDDLIDCEDTEDCCSATHCLSQPPCQPEVPEAGHCNDLLDNDGDGSVDCADSDCGSDPVCVLVVENCTNGVDDDEDLSVDCLDSDCSADPACVTPVGEAGNCADSVDNDSDGSTDCADSDCSADAACVIIPPVENCTNGADDDGDTKIDCLDTDCFVNDACQVVATETGYCADTLDNDSDGSVDCADSDCSSAPSCQTTGGGDGVCSTIDTFDYVAVGGRGRTAVANCADPDCASLPECQEPECDDPDGCEGPTETEAGHCTDYEDNDGDGALDCNDSNCASDTMCLCLFDPTCVVASYSDPNIDDDGDGFTVNGGDCNDRTMLTNPAASETCDEVDNDCDGISDEVCQGEPDVDDDGDGFCESFVFCQTGQPGDCDDNNADVKPGATEICDDDMDNNCDGHEGSADDATEGETTVPAVPALLKIARQVTGDDVEPITISDSDDDDDLEEPINPPVIDLSCEITVLNGDKGEGGGGCGCDLSGKNSSPQTATVWFFLTMIPLALVTRLRFAKS